MHAGGTVPAMTAPNDAPQQFGHPSTWPTNTGTLVSPASDAGNAAATRRRRGMVTVGLVAVALLIGGGAAASLMLVDRSTSAAVPIAKATPGPTAPWSPPAATAPVGPTRFDMAQVATTTASDGSTGTVAVAAAVVSGNAIVVTIDITCTAGQMDYNPWHWAYLGADGTPHERDIYAKLQAPMRAGTLGAGQKLHAQVAFSGSAADLHGGQVQYAPGLGGTIAYWVIP